ncbi:hypothetical protein SHKM778_40330 [Streptomyces sp. KM77-8]|uniref:AIM24 family protein n=1 Tax=Streptomyces haneummycinicus TaxID=3074435 RepID=A0AAT9HJZ1_9ACTN
MKGDLFSSQHMVRPATVAGMTVENAKCVRYTVDGEMHARQGAMIAHRGSLRFERKSQGVGGMLKRAVTGEGLPLMAVRGQGRRGSRTRRRTASSSRSTPATSSPSTDATSCASTPPCRTGSRP